MLRQISFDIYDTLLMRRVCDPTAVFYFVGREASQRQLVRSSPTHFREARIEAELLARESSRDSEVTLEDVYYILRRIIGCAPSDLTKLMGIELDWEGRVTVPVPGAVEMVSQMRATVEYINFISDMYLPKAFIEDQLRKNGFLQPRDKLWLSHEYRASKRTGKLFATFLSQTGALGKHVQHLGNDWTADVDAPKRYGIETVHLHHGNPTRYESLLERHCQATNGWASLLAGAGRLVRLQPQPDVRVAGLRRITANVVCPVLCGYVLWILKQAGQLKLSRLYFISRDGYIPYLMAKRIASSLMPSLECRYFYGSRLAWHLAGFREADTENLEWILEHGDGLTCRSLLLRLGLTWEECLRANIDLSKIISSPDAPVTEEIRQTMKRRMQVDENLRDAVKGAAEVRRNLLTAYAYQEGLLDTIPIGMVDIGWFGRTRVSLEDAIGTDKIGELQWFYLAIDQTANLRNPGRANYFLSGPELPRDEIPFLHEVVECFCLAPHGSVTGYTAVARRIEPQYKKGIEDELAVWGREHVIAAVGDYLDALDTSIGSFPDLGNIAGVTRELLAEFCASPSAEDARIWGSIPFQQDHATDLVMPLAPKASINLVALRRALQFGNVARACMGKYMGIWGAGSWAARERPLYILQFAAALGYFRLHWKRVPRVILSRLRSATRSLRTL
jgi:FMN phosphatase YigB (HAD superfamily)